MTWQLPDTYHSAGHGRGTATLKFYEGRDILLQGGAVRLVRETGKPIAQVARDLRICLASLDVSHIGLA